MLTLEILRRVDFKLGWLHWFIFLEHISTEKFAFRKIAACSEKLNCRTVMGHGFQSTTCSWTKNCTKLSKAVLPILTIRGLHLHRGTSIRWWWWVRWHSSWMYRLGAKNPVLIAITVSFFSTVRIITFWNPDSEAEIVLRCVSQHSRVNYKKPLSSYKIWNFPFVRGERWWFENK